jgi:alkylation response protein AidB-like acyl-CoA dehydrogenase
MSSVAKSKHGTRFEMSQASLQLNVQRELHREAPRSRPQPRRVHFDEAERQLERLLALLTAIAGEGYSPDAVAERREALRDSGLLAASIPAVFGGLDLDEARIESMKVRIAEVDARLARVFAVHHSQIAMILLYGDSAQQEHMLGRTVSDNGIWGSAVNSLDLRQTAVPEAGGYQLNGEKGFCAGAVGSDYLLVSAYLPDGVTCICAAVASQQRGISVRPESPGGDSARVLLEGVRVAREALLRVPAEIPLYAS